jgi:uncharacterized membrane protein YfcA
MFWKNIKLNWGTILMAIGIGILIALIIPAAVVVIILSLILIFVGYCLYISTCEHKKRF